MTRVKRAVIYARFSCSRQREASIEDQLRVCREWCAREGYEVVGEYCDHAMSGLTDDRPQFQRMIANAGESEIVLVYMMDRFSRSPYDAPIYKRELARRGVELVSAMEALPDGPERILVDKIYEGLAAVESAKTSVRVKRGMNGNAVKCLHNGVRVYGYGVGPDGRYVVDEREAGVVREVYARRCGGETFHSIASDLARRGVVTATGRPCSANMVEKIVRSRKYMGEYSWGAVVVPGGMPAIVDEATWEAASKVKARRNRADDDWGDFALTGRAVCMACGHLMSGVSGRGRNGTKYEYYACRNGDVKPVRRDWLEAEVVAGVRSMLDGGDADMLAVKVAEMVNGGSHERRKREVRSSLKEAEDGLRNLIKAVEGGMQSVSVEKRIAELEERKFALEHELEGLSTGGLDPAILAEFLRSPDGMTDADILERFVYQLLVSDDEVIVTLNYDTENNEPARFDIGRVRVGAGWCPVRGSSRTGIGMFGCAPAILIAREPARRRKAG